MSTTLILVLGVLLCGLLGLLVPALIRRIPEPVEEPEAVGEPELVEELSPVEETVEVPPTPAVPKVLYAEIAAGRALALKTGLVSAAAGGLLTASLGWHPALVFLLPLVPVLVALSVVDWHTQLLPTWVIARCYAALVPVIVVLGLVTGDWDDVFRAGWGWLITGAVYFVLWFINSAGLGYGDVRLSGIIGLALGYLGWGELFAGVYSAFILGGLIGGVLALLKIVDRKGVPFGPFMVAGALVGVLLGPWTAAHLG